MAWNLGSALSQTLFACLYIDRMNERGDVPFVDSADSIVERVLRPYCAAILKGITYVNRQVLSEYVIEVGCPSMCMRAQNC